MPAVPEMACERSVAGELERARVDRVDLELCPVSERDAFTGAVRPIEPASVRGSLVVLDANLVLSNEEVVGERGEALITFPLQAAVVGSVVLDSTSTRIDGFATTSLVPSCRTIGPQTTLTSG